MKAKRRLGLSSILRYCFAMAVGMSLHAILFSFVLNVDNPVEFERDSPPSEFKTGNKNIIGNHFTSGTCDELMETILTRQDCFHSNQLLQASVASSLPKHPSNVNNYCHSKSPFYNYALFPGQGMGRIIDHTVEQCIFSHVVLNRPCTIDFKDRDPHYTWRTFLTSPSQFHGWWDESDSNIGKTKAVLEVLETLPHLGVDGWSDKIPPEVVVVHNKHYKNETTDAMAMIWNANWTLEQHLHEWSNVPPTLVTPNWGSTWFGNVPLTQLVKKRGCTRNQLKTKVQNAMYAPTPWTMTLHKERLQRIFSSSTSSSFSEYGAIHLRTTLGNGSIKGGYDKANVVKGLSKCIKRAISLLQKKESTAAPLKNWWLISDNQTVAISMQQALSDENFINVKVDTDPSFWKDYIHSGLAMKEQRFNHAKMAPSILDYMVLHESKVAIITHGSFGETGARGRGKVSLTACQPRYSLYV